jgi:hypothetical protein
MSASLIHFTKGAWAEDYEGAFSHLQSIVNERVVRGSSSSFIKGGYSCVCLTEAPLASVRHGLVNPSNFGRYSPFGVMFEKRWVFAQGGRPVIYEPEGEYERLPESHRWRHVTYDPTAADHLVDFTWEREWRIHCTELAFGPSDAVIIVPSHDWADQLVREHQDSLIQQYSTIMDEYAAEYYGLAAFPWRIAVLDE